MYILLLHANHIQLSFSNINKTGLIMNEKIMNENWLYNVLGSFWLCIEACGCLTVLFSDLAKFVNTVKSRVFKGRPKCVTGVLILRLSRCFYESLLFFSH